MNTPDLRPPLLDILAFYLPDFSVQSRRAIKNLCSCYCKTLPSNLPEADCSIFTLSVVGQSVGRHVLSPLILPPENLQWRSETKSIVYLGNTFPPMDTSVHHQHIISASSAHHQRIFSATPAFHQCIITISSTHHQHVISTSSAHHQHIIST